MANLAASNESTHRRALRLALGVAMVFTFTQLSGWPMAHIAPFMTGLLLQDSAPLPLQRGWFILKMALISVVCGLIIALFLANFPLLLVLVACVLLFSFYLFILRSGEHMLAVIAAIIGVVLMPYLVLINPQVGAIGGLGLLLDFAVAIAGAWITWYLLPVSAPLPESHHAEPMPLEQASSMALNMVLMIAPLLAAYLAFGWSTILVLIYSVVFAATYSAEEGFSSGLKMMIANGVYGGVGMLLVYEFSVMAPSLPVVMVAVALAIWLFGLRIFDNGPTSPYWTSGLNGFLIMLGGALLADEGFTLGRIAGRIWQIALATAYVSFVLAVLAMLQDKLARVGEAEAEAEAEAKGGSDSGLSQAKTQQSVNSDI